jgi:hypothetical protein
VCVVGIGLEIGQVYDVVISASGLSVNENLYGIHLRPVRKVIIATVVINIHLTIVSVAIIVRLA